MCIPEGFLWKNRWPVSFIMVGVGGFGGCKLCVMSAKMRRTSVGAIEVDYTVKSKYFVSNILESCNINKINIIKFIWMWSFLVRRCFFLGSRLHAFKKWMDNDIKIKSELKTTVEVETWLSNPSLSNSNQAYWVISCTPWKMNICNMYICIWYMYLYIHICIYIYNPKIEVWKVIFLFNWVIFRFHDDFMLIFRGYGSKLLIPKMAPRLVPNQTKS